MNSIVLSYNKCWLLAIFFMMLPFFSIAQNPGDVAQNYSSTTTALLGFNDIVWSLALQPDGKMIVGGSFTSYNDIAENRIIRLNSDGTKDTTFNSGTGFDGHVMSIVVQPDGKIIVGGYFFTYKGLSANRIIRLNPDGTKDTSFNVGSGFNNYVRSIALQSDGKMIVGGALTLYNGVQENYIIRLNTDGTKDTSFTTGTGFDYSVFSIAIQPDGKILIGGGFNTYKGIVVNSIVRLHANGDKDTSFVTGTGFTGNIFSIVLQPDSKIIIGGDFIDYKNIAEKRIIRLNVDGTKDTSFNTGTGFNGPIGATVVQPDGKLIVGGTFSLYNGVTEKNIMRLNINGTKDLSFNIGTSLDDTVRQISMQPNGKIVISGHFTSYKDLPANRIIRLNIDGTKDTSFGASGLNNSVSSIAPQTDGKIIVGGSFTAYKGITENQILRLNPDATKDNTFNTGTGFNGSVYATTLQNDGKIIVGGYFTAYKGVTENHIIRLNPDGTKDISFNSGTGFNNSINAITLQSDAKILVGGYFISYNGLPQNDIIRLNPDGTKDASFNIGSGFNAPVEAIEVQTDGKIIIVGEFTSYNGTSANRIIRLNPDGSKDVSFNTGTGFDNSVYVATLQSDGKIIIGGSFNSYKGAIENQIIRLNTDGTKDTSFNPGTGFNYSVYTATLQSNGKIIIGGDFTTFNGYSQNHIIRLNPDGTKDSTFTTGTGFNEYISTIAVHPDGKITIGGGFTSYNNSNSSAYLITLYGDVPLSNEDFVEKNTILLWPNPVQKILNINNLDGVAESVKIYNLQGKLVYENADFAESIDVSSFASGMYIVCLKTENGNVVKKFIKS